MQSYSPSLVSNAMSSWIPWGVSCKEGDIDSFGRSRGFGGLPFSPQQQSLTKPLTTHKHRLISRPGKFQREAYKDATSSTLNGVEGCKPPGAFGKLGKAFRTTPPLRKQGPTSRTYCRPLPMMPKFCEVATARRVSKKGLNFTCASESKC